MKKLTMAIAAAGLALACVSVGVQAADPAAANDPGRDWRIALYNAQKKGAPDQDQSIHLTPQQKEEVVRDQKDQEKVDPTDVHQQGRDWRIALYNAQKKGAPDQDQSIHLTPQQKEEVVRDQKDQEKVDPTDVHQQGRDWRIALQNAAANK